MRLDAPAHRVARTGAARLLAVAALAWFAPTAAATRGADAALPVAKIHTRSAGPHAVTWENLVAGGLPLTAPLPSDGLGLTSRGVAVPSWVEDGGDGTFGPGDRLEFVAETLPGTHGRYHEYTPLNVYLLDFDSERPARMVTARARAQAAAGPDGPAALRGRLELEQDDLLMRFNCTSVEEHELWYWASLSCIDDEPFRQTLDLADLDPRPGGRVDLVLDLHGWSAQPGVHGGDLPDHVLEIRLNDELLARETWDGRLTHRIELLDLPVDRWRAGPNMLTLTVPRREHPEDEELLVDVSVLNWIELRYPKSPRIGLRPHERFELPAGTTADPRLVVAGRNDVLIYGSAGQRISFANGTRDAERLLTVPVAAAPFRATSLQDLQSPVAVSTLHDEGLATRAGRADYIIITHPSLRNAIEPLAEFRRSRGMVVEIVNVFSIYDAFNHGITHPRAIRDFLRHAVRDWTPPAPRFVLLVGDASWDSKHEQVKIENYAFKTQPLINLGVGRPEGPAYVEPQANSRGLIPAWSHVSNDGHAASDNWYACIDDDYLPDIAIGRLPVVEPEEVAAIVEKTIRFETEADARPWRRNTLWVTNEQEGFQLQSDRLAAEVAERGLVVNRVYPTMGEAGTSERIIAAIDEGQFLVYFYGHGGRNIWRTSPLDLQATQDLFTLEHLERLAPTTKLPIVLSFTCYSAPFDHPAEDSIGEKFLRLAGRGAVAVVAASWRNAPFLGMQQNYLEAFLEEATVGEAMVRAKRATMVRDVVEMYNLLGDPAVSLRPLPRTLELRHAWSADDATHVISGTIGDPQLAGNGLLEWIDERGVPIARFEFEARDRTFEWRIPADRLPTVAGTIRGYVWDEASGRSGLGTLRVEDETEPARAAADRD